MLLFFLLVYAMWYTKHVCVYNTFYDLFFCLDHTHEKTEQSSDSKVSFVLRLALIYSRSPCA